jgi:hypothetical protein
MEKAIKMNLAPVFCSGVYSSQRLAFSLILNLLQHNLLGMAKKAYNGINRWMKRSITGKFIVNSFKHYVLRTANPLK